MEVISELGTQGTRGVFGKNLLEFSCLFARVVRGDIKQKTVALPNHQKQNCTRALSVKVLAGRLRCARSLLTPSSSEVKNAAPHVVWPTQAHHRQTLFVDLRLDEGALGTFFACCAISTPPDFPLGPVVG